MDKTDAKPDDTKTPIWLTRDQVAARLGKSRSVVQKLQASGYLHPVVKTGVSLFALNEVDALARPGRRPAPWLAGHVRTRTTPAKAATGARRTEGQEAAHVFRLLEQGMSLRQIVIHARVPPHRVRSLHREWTRSLEHGAPPNSHALGDDPDLNTLANAAEQLFTRDD
jgi:hypothetical protein